MMAKCFPWKDDSLEERAAQTSQQSQWDRSRSCAPSDLGAQTRGPARGEKPGRRVCVCVWGVRHAGAQAGLTHAPTPTRDSVLLLTLSEPQTSSKTGMLHKVSRCYRD